MPATEFMTFAGGVLGEFGCGCVGAVFFAIASAVPIFSVSSRPAASDSLGSRVGSSSCTCSRTSAISSRSSGSNSGSVVVCEHFCRLLDHMDAHGHGTVEPVLDDPHMERLPLLDLAAGYVRRGVAAFPRAGASGPWTVEMAYERDVRRLRDGPVEDAALRFTPARPRLPVR
jgi:hypothetical protein